MSCLGYGPAWLDAGVLDEQLLDAQSCSTDLSSPEHFRWAMFLAYADRELQHRVSDDQLERLLALDVVESHAPGLTMAHSIAFHLATHAPLRRAQIDRVCAHDVGPSRRAFERHLLRRAIEVESTNHSRPERERSMQVRRWSRALTPVEIIRALDCASPLEATLELSSAWCAPVEEAVGAGGFMRGELDALAADELLTTVCRRHEADWLLALRIAGALAVDVIDRDLVAAARARPIQTIRWLCELAKVDLGEAKGIVTRLGAMGDELFERGALSQTIASLRGKFR